MSRGVAEGGTPSTSYGDSRLEALTTTARDLLLGPQRKRWVLLGMVKEREKARDIGLGLQ